MKSNRLIRCFTLFTTFSSVVFSSLVLSGCNPNNQTSGSLSTPYIGYDGYYWYGTERSDEKAKDVLTDYTTENTIGLVGNEYFKKDSEITSGIPFALMNNYFPNIEKTGYSNTSISLIQVYAETSGTLTISTASVNDIVNRGDYSVRLKNSTTPYNLTKGLNTIKFDTPYSIPKNDTLVLGSTNDTATLLVYQGIDIEEVQGSFSNLNKPVENSIFSQTNGINDKLVLNVEITDRNLTETEELIPGMSSYIQSLYENNNKTLVTVGGTTPGLGEVNTEGISFSYGVLKNFEEKIIDFIEVFVTSVNYPDDNQYMTVFLRNGTSVVKEYKFYARKDDLSSIRPNKIIRLYRSESDLKTNGDLTVRTGQNLAFWKAGDTVKFGFGWNSLMENGIGFATNNGIVPNTMMTLGISVYGHSYSSSMSAPTYLEHVKTLQKEEEKVYKVNELKEIVQGKRLSILGDSISTYNGQSQCGNPWYGSTTYNNVLPFESTWWKQLMDTLSLKLGVNNSYGGRSIAESLNDEINSLDDNGTPDFITVFLGTNDSWRSSGSLQDTLSKNLVSGSNGNYSYGSGSTFADFYYIVMHKVCNKYPQAKIIAVDLYKGANNAGVIADIANCFANVEVAELSSTALNESFNYGSKSLFDTYNSTREHPNEDGMDIITDAVLEAFMDLFFVNPLSNKNVSILGDSISTFNGYSNVNTYNSNINTNQEAWFNTGNPKMTSVNNTYWMSLINKFDMNLCVNESCGGDRVTGNGYLRAENLADNTLNQNQKEIVNPDIIFMHMGINDLDNNHVPVTCGTVSSISENLITKNDNGGFIYQTPTTFAEAYKITLHKLTHLYGDDVEIFCITLPSHNYKPGVSDDTNRINDFNSVITTLCLEYSNVHIVDLASISYYNDQSGITYDDIHPTNAGMQLIASKYEQELKKVF